MSKTQRCSRAVVVAALAGVAILVCGTPAEASPIRFDNPPGAGHFDWIPPVGSQEFLDFALPPSSQPGVPDGPTTLRQVVSATYGVLLGDMSGVDVQTGGSYDAWVVGVDAGVLIPSGFLWTQSPYIAYHGWPEQELPEGVETYVGVRFDLGLGSQYGWIGVVRDDLTLDAFAWGYETEVGVPIAAGVPEPGTLALLALGALAVAGRRQRGNEAARQQGN